MKFIKKFFHDNRHNKCIADYSARIIRRRVHNGTLNDAGRWATTYFMKCDICGRKFQRTIRECVYTRMSLGSIFGKVQKCKYAKCSIPENWKEEKWT